MSIDSTRKEEIKKLKKEILKYARSPFDCEDLCEHAIKELIEKLGSSSPEREERFTKDEITKAIKKQWLADYGEMDNACTDYRTGFFMIGFIQEALREFGGVETKEDGQG